MKVNTDLIWQKYFKTENDKFKSNINDIQDEQLKKAANEFTSILIKQMLKSMRETIPEKKLLDAGFAEDVFTDMLDGEISKLGSGSSGFNNLSKLLYEQLKARGKE